MNLALLLALKMAHDQNQASARRRRRAREDARKKKNAPQNSSSSYSSKTYEEAEYFNMIITEDPVLATFFKELEKKGVEIDEVDAEEVRKVIEEKLKLQSERAEKIQKKFEEIKAAGLDIAEGDSYYDKITVGEKVLDAGKPAFGDKGEYVNTRKGFALEYKGIKLAREWFKGDRKKDNFYEIRYNKWYEEHKDLENEIQAAEEAIRVQERKVKFAIFGKEDKQYKLEDLRSNLGRLRRIQEEGESLREKRDILAEITPKQKDLIEEYFDMVEECKEAAKDVDKNIEKYNQIKEVSYHYSYNRGHSEEERNKWQRALDALIADGEASEELLDAIDGIISEEKVGYQKYSEGKDKYQMQREGYSERFTNLVAWYLRTRREKIIEKALARKEAAYKVLTTEHKRLCELAGLVDEAEKIEETLGDKKGDEGHGEHDDE